jgi:hypothetical protein
VVAIFVTAGIFGNIVKNSFKTVFNNDCFTMQHGSAVNPTTNPRNININIAPAVGAAARSEDNIEDIGGGSKITEKAPNQLFGSNRAIKVNNLMVLKDNKINNSLSQVSEVGENPKSEIEMKKIDNTDRENVKLNNTDVPEMKPEFTERDYRLMTVDESLKHDTSGFGTYYFKVLSRTHLILAAFYYKTLFKPQYIRIIAFFLSISFYFALNAVFYTDDFIETRSARAKSSTVLLFIIL